MSRNEEHLRALFSPVRAPSVALLSVTLEASARPTCYNCTWELIKRKAFFFHYFRLNFMNDLLWFQLSPVSHSSCFCVLSVYPSVVHLFIVLSIVLCLSVVLSIILPFYRSVVLCRSVILTICCSFRLSIYRSICHSMSIVLSFSQFFFRSVILSVLSI